MSHFQMTSDLILKKHNKKMYKLSIKLSHYIRWVSVLQSVKDYKQHQQCGRYTRFYLKKMNDNDINDISMKDVLNCRLYLEISDPNTKDDIKFNDLKSIHTRSNSFSQYYKILNRHYRVMSGNIDEYLKREFKKLLPQSNIYVNDENITIEPNVCVTNISDYKMSPDVLQNYIIKFNPSSLKWKDFNNKNRVSKYPEFFIIPNITINNSIHIFPEHLKNLYQCYSDIVEQYRRKIITLYDEVIDRQPPPPPMYVHQNETKFDDCCVCYETTNYYTNCNHTLCIECSKKLPRKYCPICRNNLNLPRQVQVETFNGETKEVEQEQKEETQEEVDRHLRELFGEITDEENELLEVRLLHKYNPDFHFTIYKRYIIDYQRLVVNSKSIQIYKFQINIPDTDIMNLFPTILRNPDITMIVNETMGWVEICVR